MRAKIQLACLLVATAFPWKADAWGEKGHHLICDEASRLVTESGMKEFLKMRGHVMGHTCNVPDIHWKSLPVQVSRIGNATHFIEPDMIGMSITDTPTIFADFIAKLTAVGNPVVLTDKVGTLWWRAEQLFKESLTAAKTIGGTVAPTTAQEEQLNDLPYNQAIYTMMTNMGLMGHYLGDASMPYHNWADYDGYGVGRGGIHAYYESVCPGEFGSEFAVQVRTLARKIKYGTAAMEIPVLLKKLSVEAASEVANVEELDVVIEASTQTVNEHGMTVRKPGRSSRTN